MGEEIDCEVWEVCMVVVVVVVVVTIIIIIPYFPLELKVSFGW